VKDYLDDDRLEKALNSAFGPPLEPDFDGWRQRHPEAIAALKAHADLPAGEPALRRLRSAVGGWLVNHRRVSIASACAVGALLILATWIHCSDPLGKLRRGAAKPDKKVAVNSQTSRPESLPRAEHPQREPTATKRKSSLGHEGPGTTEAVVPPPLDPAPPQAALSSSAPSKSDHVGGAASTTRRIPLSVRLVYYSSVVRAKMVDITPKHVEFSLTKVLYGTDPGEIFRVPCIPDVDSARQALRTALRFDGTTGPYNPSDAEVWEHVLTMNRFAKGSEVILLLQDRRETAINPEYQWWGTWGDSLRSPIDRYQEKILDVFESGSHLTPPGNPDDLAIYIQLSEKIVRARLVKIADDSAQWELVGKVHYPWLRRSVGPQQPAEAGDGPPVESLDFSLEPWRIRAEAIVRRGLTLQPGQSPPEEAVRRQLSLLVGQELKPGKEAVLFLRHQRKDGLHKTRHPMLGIVYADPVNPRSLDQLESSIVEIIEKRRHEAVR